MLDKRSIEKKKKYEEVMKMKEISLGGFIKYGIVSQEQFDKFYENIPIGFTRIRKCAKSSWEKFQKYATSNIEELQEKKEKMDDELKHLDYHRFFLKRGVMVDYRKVQSQTIEKLEKMKAQALQVHDIDLTKFNRKNFRVTNPLVDIIIDDDAKDYYNKDRYIVERFERHYSMVEGELNMINSIIDMKKREEASKGIADETKQEYSTEPELEKIEADYDVLSIEKLQKVEEGLASEVNAIESQKNNLQTSISKVEEQIKNERKRQEIIARIKEKRELLKQGNIDIENLKQQLNSKQQEYAALEDKQRLQE